MEDATFALRLAKLRTAKGVSAREMSLALGQCPGYINAVETGRGRPSMTVFYYICDYLGVTPAEFFDEENECPVQLREIMTDLKKLDYHQLEHISAIIKGLTQA